MTRKAADMRASAADLVAFAKERQKAYAAHRRNWAKSVGRPYTRDYDLRPPPGELDASPEE